MSKTAQKISPEVQESMDRLRKWFPKGSTVYTILRNVSRSGMTRDIGMIGVVCVDGGKIHHVHPNRATATVLGLPLKRDAVRVSGCGMDMGFHIVNSLSRRLYGDDYALKHEWL